jgi:hypothetical protein
VLNGKRLRRTLENPLIPPLRAPERYQDCFFRSGIPDEANKAEAPKRNASRGIAFTAAVIVLESLGMWLWRAHAGQPAVAAGAETGIKATLHLESFVLNRADP